MIRKFIKQINGTIIACCFLSGTGQATSTAIPQNNWSNGMATTANGTPPVATASSSTPDAENTCYFDPTARVVAGLACAGVAVIREWPQADFNPRVAQTFLELAQETASHTSMDYQWDHPGLNTQYNTNALFAVFYSAYAYLRNTETYPTEPFYGSLYHVASYLVRSLGVYFEGDWYRLDRILVPHNDADLAIVLDFAFTMILRNRVATMNQFQRGAVIYVIDALSHWIAFHAYSPQGALFNKVRDTLLGSEAEADSTKTEL